MQYTVTYFCLGFVFSIKQTLNRSIICNHHVQYKILQTIDQRTISLMQNLVAITCLIQ